MSNYGYVIEEINGKRYIRGWSVTTQAPDYLTIFPDEPDMPEGRQDEYGNYQYIMDGQDVVYDPQVPDPQKVENKIQEQLAAEGKQFILRDDDGDVRWRIVINEEGKLQIERDPIDKPHIGQWLLNGQLAVPKLQDGELIIKLNGELQAITISDLKQLMDNEQ